MNINAKKLVAMATLTSLLIAAFPSEARLATNSRRAVVLEAYHALRANADGGCDKKIGVNCAGSWNYLADDYNAYVYMKGKYSSDSSVWSSFYSNVWDYGFNTSGGNFGNVGRGGQCKFFANLVLYRSGTGSSTFPSYSSMWSNTQTDMTKLKEGDVILTYNRGITQHVAIVTDIARDSSGKITAADVVDSNFLTDTTGSSREVIGKHSFSISYLKSYYRIFKGTAYYSEPYALY